LWIEGDVDVRIGGERLAPRGHAGSRCTRPAAFRRASGRGSSRPSSPPWAAARSARRARHRAEDLALASSVPDESFCAG
jgi:hypothetical protein